MRTSFGPSCAVRYSLASGHVLRKGCRIHATCVFFCILFVSYFSCILFCFFLHFSVFFCILVLFCILVSSFFAFSIYMHFFMFFVLIRTHVLTTGLCSFSVLCVSFRRVLSPTTAGGGSVCYFLFFLGKHIVDRRCARLCKKTAGFFLLDLGTTRCVFFLFRSPAALESCFLLSFFF